ncbi:DUF2207 domain-containing protein [Kitasatospora purpeofusca]|uniref:hypothetical protein n=1 Tax=Kitasatospora purpeofusca TaxID=67352 RepID=UPI00382D4A53
MRGPGRGTAGRRAGEPEELTLHELALLAGGAWRAAETALARMLLDAGVEIDRHGTVRVVRPRPRDEVEAVLLAALRSGAPLPPGWRLSPDALSPAGRTTWAAVAATGVPALGRHRLTTAFHGPRPRRRGRERPDSPCGGRRPPAAAPFAPDPPAAGQPLWALIPLSASSTASGVARARVPAWRRSVVRARRSPW